MKDNDRTTAAPAAPAEDPAALWYSKDPETQWKEILSAARAACVLRQDLARRAGRPAPEEIAGAAWIRLTEALMQPRGRRLDQLQLYAALTALTAAARENTHSVGGTRIDDGAPIPEAAPPGADRRPVENADPVGDMFPPGDPLGTYCRLLYAGYSPEEIAAATGDSRRRVYYIRDLIRDRITAARAR